MKNKNGFDTRMTLQKTLQHIAVCGNIGSGKTTLTEKLATHYGWTAMTESVEDNPYLRDFYEDMPRWAFHVQIFFLNSRFRQVTAIRNNPGTVIQDRTIYEDAYIFAANLHRSGFISDRDYHCYLEVFRSMIRYVTPPDLLVYLKADLPKLQRQIRKRARDYEANLRPEYLQNLNQRYEEWTGNYDLGKMLVIDVTEMDFALYAEDFAAIVASVDNALSDFPRG